MKRILSMILALLVLMSLCACSTTPGSQPQQDSQASQNGQSSQDQSNDKPSDSADDPSYALILNVTINPEFTLYLDSEMNILSVEAKNADAETLLAQLDISGKSYDEGMGLVLNAAYEEGYLKDSGQITIGVTTASTDPTFDFSMITAPVSIIEQEKLITTDLSLQMQEEFQDVESTIIDGEKYYIHHIPVMSGGQPIGVDTTYTKQRIILFDPLAKAIKSVYQGYNGDMSVTYYENGEPIMSYSTTADGTYSSTEYEYADGNLVKKISSNSDNSKTTYFYDSEGNVTSIETVWPNGDYDITTYVKGGNIPATMESFRDGRHSNVTYSESGRPAYSTFRDTDGSYGEMKYDDEGNLAFGSTYYANGDYEIQSYGEDGNLTIESLRNGNYSKMLLADLNLAIYILEKHADGTQHEATYFKNGNVDTANWTYPNGDYQTYTYYEDGTLKSEIIQKDGNYFKREFNPDGSQQYESNGGNEYFFSGGLLVKAIVDGVTYTDAESLSHFAAGLGIEQ